MKQLAQYQDGRLEIQEVAMPSPPPGGLLVRTTHSAISLGTEKMKVEQAKMNLLQKARARPDQVRKVMDTARNLGWRSAWEKVRNRLESPSPLGYSAAGIVEAVHSGNTRFRVGDRVACGGAECAFHAEYIALPDMLAAPVPDEVAGWQAAYTTITSIALQAVRQAETQLGGRALVLGQGLVGLLVTNLLEIAGVRVMAVDRIAGRRPLCEAMGSERTVILGEEELEEAVRSWTEGYGVDVAIVCASGSSNSPVEQAAAMLRDRGRLVQVGMAKMELPWRLFYEKELEVRFSRSYGPGRYDPSYEWAGEDYPIGYVRWTEQRNFQTCLDLMRRGKLRLDALTTRRSAFVDALKVYEDLMRPEASDVGVILEYGPREADKTRPKSSTEVERSADEPLDDGGDRKPRRPVDQLDVIGAGNFARTMLLPHLQGRLRFGTVVNQTSLSAQHVKGKFDFERAATETEAVLAGVSSEKDENGERALLIATRHHLHAPLTRSGLTASRHVFVEKPLCLTRAELADIQEAYAVSRGTVQVGFNRRFAPASRQLKALLKSVSGPITASVRVMPGKLDPEHWYANYDESGGRVIGEACHFFDYFCFLFESKPVRVFAQPTRPMAGRMAYPDSIAAQVEFEDGSCGQLVYTSEGDTRYPKERLTVYAPGLVADVSNFQSLEVYRERKRKAHQFRSKGHAEQMAAWLDFLAGKREHPLPLNEACRSMELTFAALDSIQQGQSVACDGLCSLSTEALGA